MIETIFSVFEHDLRLAVFVLLYHILPAAGDNACRLPVEFGHKAVLIVFRRICRPVYIGRRFPTTSHDQLVPGPFAALYKLIRISSLKFSISCLLKKIEVTSGIIKLFDAKGKHSRDLHVFAHTLIPYDFVIINARYVVPVMTNTVADIFAYIGRVMYQSKVHTRLRRRARSFSSLRIRVVGIAECDRVLYRC